MNVVITYEQIKKGIKELKKNGKQPPYKVTLLDMDAMKSIEIYGDTAESIWNQILSQQKHSS